MKYKSDHVIEYMENHGALYIDTSSCWDWHHNNLSCKPGSNLHACASELFKKYNDVDKIGVKVGAIGWNQHSKTELILFKCDDCDLEDWEVAKMIRREELGIERPREIAEGERLAIEEMADH